jgi:hypothetical protein
MFSVYIIFGNPSSLNPLSIHLIIVSVDLFSINYDNALLLLISIILIMYL